MIGEQENIMPETNGNKKLLEEVGVAAVIAVLAGAVLYFVVENQKTGKGGTTPSGTGPSATGPSGTGGTTPSGTSGITPSISISPTTVNLVSQTGLLGNVSITYSPSTLTITGNGFTPSILGQQGGKVQIQDENGDILSTINSNSSDGTGVYCSFAVLPVKYCTIPLPQSMPYFMSSPESYWFPAYS